MTGYLALFGNGMTAILKNDQGVAQYPKGDARRLFVLLAAIDFLQRPTLNSISTYTGHNKGTIDHDVERLTEQFGVVISKTDMVYTVLSWGGLLTKDYVKKVLHGIGD